MRFLRLTWLVHSAFITEGTIGTLMEPFPTSNPLVQFTAGNEFKSLVESLCDSVALMYEPDKMLEV